MLTVINLYVLETLIVMITPCQIKGHCNALLNAALYNFMVLLHADVTCIQWSFYFKSCDPVSSNQMTLLMIFVKIPSSI